jgi:AcrR family transcriptional regulator
VPRGLIAYYFATKEGLFEALGRERAESIERIEPRVRRGPNDPLAWTLSLFALGNASVDWVHLLIWEGLDWESPDPSAGKSNAVALESDRRAFWEGRIAEVRRFQGQGKLPAQLDPRQLTFFLYSGCTPTSRLRSPTSSRVDGHLTNSFRRSSSSLCAGLQTDLGAPLTDVRRTAGYR